MKLDGKEASCCSFVLLLCGDKVNALNTYSPSTVLRALRKWSQSSQRPQEVGAAMIPILLVKKLSLKRVM